MKEHLMDWAREARTGVPEAVFCAGKSLDQIAAILEEAREAERSLLFTRLAPEAFHALDGGDALDYDPVSATGVLDFGLAEPTDAGVAIVAAGTSDAPVVHEARRTLAFSGVDAAMYFDVGVAGLWRTIDCAEKLQDRRVVIAVAGFEGALFSVLPGLVAAPVIATPTSIGAGVATDGQAALSTALASCAPGVVAVNIDNGFGAACAALKIIRAADIAPTTRKGGVDDS